METDLARLIVRHRHVAPMLSALLTGTNAAVRITAGDGTVILEREGSGIGADRFPIAVEGETVGWVEGDRVARAIASVLSYACSREADKRSLAREALDRYRELTLVYGLADALSGALDVAAVATTAVAEASRLPAGGTGFLLLLGKDGRLHVVAGGDGDPTPVDAAAAGEGILAAVAASGVAEVVNDVRADPRATTAERAFASLVGAPLVVRGRTIGVLATGSEEPVEYRSADLKLLTAIAAITGPAIDQARAHERARGAAPVAGG